ncbi:formin-binding protein 4-like [Xenia sp. Carnegie-2017]|uniref:formin-binding protein 4-like n=1 Tax=Xenia sp. Carnegie-2017 TaxID=2897299 RepID=UPI001F03B5D8|nr:formin-binding protein 4-like [Xenia sp. Carnegie-2017]
MGRRNREKANAASVSRRRTILQIEPVSRRKEDEVYLHVHRRKCDGTKREVNPTSISGIGLLGEYAEESDEEDEEMSSQRIEDGANVEKKTENNKEKKEIDSKLSNFLKEIEAISTDSTMSKEHKQDNPEESQVDAIDDQNIQDYVLPEPWQQVCDPNTNYMYYWNTLTNEVSWELPESLISTSLPMSAVDNKVDAVVSNTDISLNTSANEEKDGSKNVYEESVDTERNILNDPEAASDSGSDGVEGIPVKSDDAPGTLTLRKEKDFEAASDSTLDDSPDNGVVSLDKSGHKDKYQEEAENIVSNKESLISKSLPTKIRAKKESVDMFQDDSRELDTNDNDNNGSQVVKLSDDKRLRNAVAEDMPERSPNLAQSVTSPTPDELNEVEQGESPLIEKTDIEEVVTTLKRSKKENESDDEGTLKKPKVESESESEGDFAEKLLEEFLEGKPCDAGLSGDDMDVDNERDQETSGDTTLLPPEAFEHNRSDRITDEKTLKKVDAPEGNVKVDNGVDEENEKLTLEIHDLCQLLSSKLEFLNVRKDDLNKLVIVLIQMETRIRDWREGGLSSTYIVKKLREAAQELTSYELSAVPEGWTCHWESTYKRYFYTNSKTGESQWEFPQISINTINTDVSSVPGAGTDITGRIVEENAANISSSKLSSVDNSRSFHDLKNIKTDAPSGYSYQAPVVDETDVTKDPYRFLDDSPPVPKPDNDHEPSVSPPPLPTDVLIEPPPPPPQSPPSPPRVTNMKFDKSRSTVRTSTDTTVFKQAVKSSVSKSSPVPTQVSVKQKKKKSKPTSAPIRSSKVKQMSSLVQKWQAIKQQEASISEEESEEEDFTTRTEAQIQQWRQEQIESGLAADNPNFQKITGDWRERVRKAKLRKGILDK